MNFGLMTTKIVYGYGRSQGNGASCHVGYRSCFYRSVPTKEAFEQTDGRLVYEEDEKVFDPKEVYGDAPNPTIL